jgi:hypothetical protein
MLHLLTHPGYGICKEQHLFRVLSQQVQHQPEGGLTPYTWQFGELLHSLL